MSRKRKGVIVLLLLVLVVGNCVLGYCLYQERKWSNVYFRHMMEAEDGVGKPILVEALPDGTYDRLGAVDLNAERYTFVRLRGRGNDTAVAVESRFWKVPDRFVWKDRRFLDIDPN